VQRNLLQHRRKTHQCLLRFLLQSPDRINEVRVLFVYILHK
jgi:hypothetical protein